MAQKTKTDIRKGVHTRIRKKVRGSTERPRLAVYRSLNHIYAQVIDDTSGKTLATASTTEKAFAGKSGGNIDAAKYVGKAVAERAIQAGVESVVFDRGGYLYHRRGSISGAMATGSVTGRRSVPGTSGRCPSTRFTWDRGGGCRRTRTGI